MFFIYHLKEEIGGFPPLSPPISKMAEIIIEKKGEDLIAFYQEKKVNLTPEEFDILRNRMLEEAKKIFKEYVLSKEVKDNFILIAKETKIIIDDRLEGKFCPFMIRKCRKEECIFYKEMEHNIDNTRTIVKDCLKRYNEDFANKTIQT